MFYLESSNPILILDTTFFISYGANQYWTNQLIRVIENPSTTVVIPESVEEQFEKIQKSGKKDRFGFPLIDSDLTIEDLLEREDLDFYETKLEDSLSDRLYDMRFKRGEQTKTVRKVGKDVVQTAIDEAKDGHTVVVASANEAIVSAVEILVRDEYRYLSLGTHSPYGLLKIRDNEHPDLICTPKTFAKLRTLNWKANTRKYFVAASKVKFGDKYSNVGFEIVELAPGEKAPSANGITYVPIGLLHISESTMKHSRTNFFLFQYPQFALYCPNYPRTVVSRTQEPIPLYRLVAISKTGRNPQMLNKQLTQLDEAEHSLSTVPCAEHYNLKRHNHFAYLDLVKRKKQFKALNCQGPSATSHNL